MDIEQIMKHDVKTASPGQTLAEVARIMWEGDVGCLPVVDAHRRPIGMITDRDICMAAYTKGLALTDMIVAEAMSRHVVQCTTSTSLADVELSMRDAQVRRMPVVDESCTLVGIVTLADLAHAAQSIQVLVDGPGVLRTLSGITERRWHGQLAAE
jgi:CBS domain-containing protein